MERDQRQVYACMYYICCNPDWPKTIAKQFKYMLKITKMNIYVVMKLFKKHRKLLE